MFNLYKCLSSVEHKKGHLRNSRHFFHTVEIKGIQNGLVTFYKISYFVFHRRKYVLQVWNDMRVSQLPFYVTKLS